MLRWRIARIPGHALSIGRLRWYSATPVLNQYLDMVQQGKLVRDDRQVALAKRLDRLGELIQQYQTERIRYAREIAERQIKVGELLAQKQKNQQKQVSSEDQLIQVERDVPPVAPIKIPRGVYIHGNVGTGKTMLMDLFFKTLDVPKSRVHLHSFLQDVHATIHRERKKNKKLGGRVAIEELGRQLAKDNAAFAFDEFFVTDIADAAILQVLLAAMMNQGTVLIATSNASPEDLHESFTPFLPRLLAHCKVHDIESETDYREAGSTSFVSRPFHIVSNDAHKTFQEFMTLNAEKGTVQENVKVECGFGRSVFVPYAWKDFQTQKNVAGAPFAWLCGSRDPILGPNEYSTICKLFKLFVVFDVPLIRIQPGRIGDESRRFGTFIDVAYDAGTQVITISNFEHLFVVDEEVNAADTPEVIASIRSFLRARSRWQQLSRGKVQTLVG